MASKKDKEDGKPKLSVSSVWVVENKRKGTCSIPCGNASIDLSANARYQIDEEAAREIRENPTCKAWIKEGLITLTQEAAEPSAEPTTEPAKKDGE